MKSKEIYCCKGGRVELNAIEIGNTIRQIRKIANLSQEKFARTIHLSTQTVSNMENGRVVPTIHTLANIAEHYEMSVDTLLRR